MSVPRIGFIGLGNIGLPMARRITAAGLAPTVHDLRAAPVRELVAAGALNAPQAFGIGAPGAIRAASLIEMALGAAIGAAAGGAIGNALDRLSGLTNAGRLLIRFVR